VSVIKIQLMQKDEATELFGNKKVDKAFKGAL